MHYFSILKMDPSHPRFALGRRNWQQKQFFLYTDKRFVCVQAAQLMIQPLKVRELPESISSWK